MLKIKDIQGWEDYTIDIDGNVFSKRKKKYLKQETNKYGYCKVKLQKNKYQRTMSVHRLVAENFLQNENNYPQVNHIDGNKKNNNISNLEWCSAKHNMNEAVRIGLFDKVKGLSRERAIKNNLQQYHILANEKTKKPVNQFLKNGEFVKKWLSMSDASRELGIPVTSISYCCSNKRKSGGGYIWHYALKTK